MSAEDCRGALNGNWFCECTPNDLGLAFARDRCDQLGHTEQRGDGERDCILRDLLNAAKPPLRSLLLPACSVQFNNLHVEWIGEVCYWRMVEGQVAIFSNAEETQLRIG